MRKQARFIVNTDEPRDLEIGAEKSAATSKPHRQDASDEGVSLNDFYAYMPLHSYIYAPSRETWPVASVNGRIPPVQVFDANGKPVLGKNNEPKVMPASTWLVRTGPWNK